MIELQPEVNAFAITEQHGLRNNDKYALSAFGHRFQQDYVLKNRLGVHTSVNARRASRHDRDVFESDSIRGLTENSVRPDGSSNHSKQTADIDIKYAINQV